MTDPQRTQREIDLETAREVLSTLLDDSDEDFDVAGELIADALAAARDQGARSMDARVAAARAEARSAAMLEAAAMLRERSNSIALSTRHSRSRETSERLDTLDSAADDVEALAAMELAGQPAPEPARTASMHATALDADLAVGDAIERACVTPNGRTDGHEKYVRLIDGKVSCMFCGKPVGT